MLHADRGGLNMSRAIEQKRAKHALDFVDRFKTADSKVQKKLSTHIQKTPIRILQNGIGQAAAFLLADAEQIRTEPSYKLYAHMQDWLCGPADQNYPSRVYGCQQNQANLMKQLIEGDRASYVRAQEEALALFTWLKKFADAYLETESQGGSHAGAAQPQP